MKNPFLIEGPALISFSGGRTSAYMLYQILAAHGWVLPDDIHAVFADTGKEHAETYAFIDRCEQEWGAKITRVAYDKGNHATPYDALISRKKYLPNPRARFCTQYLKILPLAAFMAERGYETWTNVVGIRADEPSRIVKIRGNSADDAWSNVLPLADVGATKADVMRFWEGNDFDLGIPPGDGNCVGCFLKGAAQLIAIEQRTPGSLQWYADKEAEIGGTFRNDRPPYAELIDFARRQQTMDFGSADVLQECLCHD